MNDSIVPSYVHAQAAKISAFLNNAMSSAAKAERLNMEALVGSDQDRREERLAQRDQMRTQQETETTEAVGHLLNLIAAWSTATASEPIPLLWAVFKLYRDGDSYMVFELIGVARSEVGAQKLANLDGAGPDKAGADVITIGSRFEYGDGNYGDGEIGSAYLIEAVKIEP